MLLLSLVLENSREQAKGKIAVSSSEKEIDPKELFWITKNGIKMTGMPAWGKNHSDEKIWAIVAFLKTLPTLTKEQYQNFNDETKGESDKAELNTKYPF